MIKNDTIYALATPPGRSGVAVMRVSGPDSLSSLKSFLSKDTIRIKPRHAHLINLYSPKENVSRETSVIVNTGNLDRKIIDKALVIYFKAPHSFTGEDVIEYHLHGSPAVISELSAYLSRMPGHRPAERGEFTRRGFENGCMDLTEAEAIADLIDAETAAQKDQALSQLSGTLRELYEAWAQNLTRILAFLEAHLDFPDEELPIDPNQQVFPQINALIYEIQTHLNDNRRGERLRDGIKIAVIGAPNAGKSSLVNMLAARDIAITSDFAGTTRDVLEVHLDIAGYPVILSDTAGLKPGLIGKEGQTHQDKIESEGIRRALQVAETADLKLLVFDASETPDPSTLALQDEHSLIVFNKLDLVSGKGIDHEGLGISIRKNQGITTLLEGLKGKIEKLIGQSTTPSLTRERHRHALEECLEALRRSKNAALPELIAEDLRLAVRALGKITGRVDVEDLLDVIFSEFCIGK